MSIYTTPLQFGYFFSLLMWVLLLIRGYKNQRLSDKLLGWIMFILAMEMQDYTYGMNSMAFREALAFYLGQSSISISAPK